MRPYILVECKKERSLYFVDILHSIGVDKNRLFICVKNGDSTYSSYIDFESVRSANKAYRNILEQLK